MNEIVVLDLINNERNTFGSVSEAGKWILDNYADEVEGIHPDIESVQILQVLKQVEVEELDNKKHKVSFVPVELPVKVQIAEVNKIIKGIMNFYQKKPMGNHFEENSDRAKIQVLKELLQKLKDSNLSA